MTNKAVRPKSAQSGFRFFSVKYKQAVLDTFPHLKSKQVAQVLARCWKELPPRCKQPFLSLARSDYERYQQELVAFAKGLGEEIGAVAPHSRKRKLGELSSPQQPYVLFLKDMMAVAKDHLKQVSFNEFQSHVAKEWRTMPLTLRQHWIDRAKAATHGEPHRATSRPLTSQQRMPTLSKDGSVTNSEDSVEHEQIMRSISAMEGMRLLAPEQPTARRQSVSKAPMAAHISICTKSLEKATKRMKKLYPDCDTLAMKSGLDAAARRLCGFRKVDPFTLFVAAAKAACYPSHMTFNDVQSDASIRWHQLTRTQKQVFGQIGVHPVTQDEVAADFNAPNSSAAATSSGNPTITTSSQIMSEFVHQAVERSRQHREPADEASADTAPATSVLRSSHDNEVVQALFTMSEAAAPSPIKTSSAKKQRHDHDGAAVHLPEQPEQTTDRSQYFHADGDFYHFATEQFGIHQMSAEEIGAAATMTALGGAMTESDAEFELLGGEAETEAQVLRLLAGGMFNGIAFDL